MMSLEPQFIFWGKNTQSWCLIWAFMGNLGSVETDVNACREPSTPVDTVLLLVKTQLGREGQKGVARGLFKRRLQTLMLEDAWKARLLGNSLKRKLSLVFYALQSLSF